jgi:hypothetical protein
LQHLAGFDGKTIDSLSKLLRSAPLWKKYTGRNAEFMPIPFIVSNISTVLSVEIFLGLLLLDPACDTC